MITLTQVRRVSVRYILCSLGEYYVREAVLDSADFIPRTGAIHPIEIDISGSWEAFVIDRVEHGDSVTVHLNSNSRELNYYLQNQDPGKAKWASR